MNSLFASPSLDDLIRLLKAWKFWLLGAILGALIGAAVYYILPATYRARATVNVDFNLEQAWPQETDRQQFYYLERESRKLEEIAWSDDVLEAAASASSITVDELGDGRLKLGQPAEAGWHFYAEDKDPERARELAANWAKSFEAKVRETVSNEDGLNSFIKVDATQTKTLPVERNLPLSTALVTGSILCLTISAIGILFFGKQQ